MSIIVQSIEGNRQRLDGGSMFGNVPRALWAEWIPPDERHRIKLACRTFLLQDEAQGRRILLEAGIGVFFDPTLQDRFGVEEPAHQLLAGLGELGLQPADIDLVILSHLHFDHAGGLLSAWRPEGTYELVFPRAHYLVSQRAWERANSPHQRDRASFIPELLRLLGESQRLELVSGPTSTTLGPRFTFTYSDGHTPGMLLTEIHGAETTAVFCGDLIPGRPWIHLPVTMGYDRCAELLIDEKQQLLQRVVTQKMRLLLTHDPACACCGVQMNERGRYGAVDELPVVTGFLL